jgi:HSP20 family protein
VRSFTVPKDADEKSVRADFKEGVLSVHVAKSEVPKPRTIDIKVA